MTPRAVAANILAIGLMSSAITMANLKITENAAHVSACAPTGPALTILTVGDSITEGATMTTSVSPSYRAELGRLLDAACVSHTFAVAAKGGTTCGYWSDKMAGLMATHQPDVVLIACGTNDRLDNKTPAQITAWEGVYRSLFDTVLDYDPDVIAYPAFIQYSTTPSTQCTTPPGPAPLWLRASEAKDNDAIYRAMPVIDEWHARVPDFIDYQKVPPAYIDACGVHPTPGGYDVMGRIAYAKLAQYFSWPSVEMPCALTGRRDGYPMPTTRVPCNTMNVG